MKKTRTKGRAAPAPAEARRKDPYARLVRVLERGGGAPRLDAALERLAERLAQTSEEGALQISIPRGDELEASVIRIGSSRASVERGGTESPRLEVIIDGAALEEVLAGDRSPIAAMARGQMRLRGDVEFGKHLYRRLAADDGVIDPCERGGRAS